MDSASRVRAAIALERPDRPPVAWWGHTFEQEWSPAALAEVTISRARRYGWDFVKLQPRACCFAEAFGSQYRPSGDPFTAPVLEKPAVVSVQDWAALPHADAASPPLADQVEAISRIAAELGPSVPVIQTVFSPLTVAGYLVAKDKQRLLTDLRESPDEMREALERITRALISFSIASVEAGAAGIFYAVSGYGGRNFVEHREYERLVLGYDLQVLQALSEDAWFNVLHLCGPHLHFDLAGILPAQAVSWSVHDRGNPSLVQGRNLSGKAVMGGLDQIDALVSASPEQLLHHGRAAVEETEGRGFLLAPGCSVPVNTPEENLQAIGRAVS